MSEEQMKPDNLLDTTDSLEAVGVCRSWKNFLFIIIIISLIALQFSFWVINSGYAKADEAKPTVKATPAKQEVEIPAMNDEEEPNAMEIGMEEEIVTSMPEITEVAEAAKKVAEDMNSAIEKVKVAPKEEHKKGGFSFDFYTRKRAAGIIRFFDFILVIAATLYCLTMLFILKISLLGRLGGINHIARAFFLSLLLLVFLLPWQRLFPGVAVGAIYLPGDLFRWYDSMADANILCKILYYLRFPTYWLLCVLTLLFAQMRSGKWAKATLRRLEII